MGEPEWKQQHYPLSEKPIEEDLVEARDIICIRRWEDANDQINLETHL